MVMVFRPKKTLSLLCLCLLYGVVSIITAYYMLGKHKSKEIKDKATLRGNFIGPKKLHIWDTSGVGLYLWKHILGGSGLSSSIHSDWYEDVVNVSDLHIKYRLGYGIPPSASPYKPVENMLLVLNGRDEKVVKHARIWIDFLLNYDGVFNLGLLLLGDEYCSNQWLKKYLKEMKLRLIFLIYDSSLIDDKRVFSWPLGVASYRHFPMIDTKAVLETSGIQRSHLCNFVGTVYADSPRQKLQHMLENEKTEHPACKLVTRNQWVVEESFQNNQIYRDILYSSDFTISPGGKNTECYRTYEAIELGSIPIVEDISMSATCNSSFSDLFSPYLVLKKYKAPIIFLKDFSNQLPDTLKHLNRLSQLQRANMRLKLVNWYIDFKNDLKALFVNNILNLFHWSGQT